MWGLVKKKDGRRWKLKMPKRKWRREKRLKKLNNYMIKQFNKLVATAAVRVAISFLF
jgi:hypothetical protein